MNNGDDDSYDEINKKWRKIWRNAVGQVHRDGDLPAIIRFDSSIYYLKSDNLHRDDD